MKAQLQAATHQPRAPWEEVGSARVVQARQVASARARPPACGSRSQDLHCVAR